MYPIFFGDPQGGELRTRPRARAARAHAGARSALFIFSVKIDSSLKLPLLYLCSLSLLDTDGRDAIVIVIAFGPLEHAGVLA